MKERTMTDSIFDPSKLIYDEDASLGNLHIQTEKNDVVNHPSHYTDGKVEVIDYIEDKKLGFHLGNTVKYISRAGKKDSDKTLEDLKKAKWYLDRYIEWIDDSPKEVPKLEQCQDVWKIMKKDPGLYQDPYLGAMYNGMELMMAILEGRAPDYVAVEIDGRERTHAWMTSK